MRKIYLFILMLLNVFCLAQNINKIDSLKNALIIQNDSLKVDAYRNLINSYMYSKIDSSKVYSNQLKQYAYKNKSFYAKYSYYYTRAFINYTMAEYDSVVFNLNASLLEAKKADNILLQIESHIKLGNVLLRINKKEEAKKHMELALAIANTFKIPRGIADSHIEIGNFYFYDEKLDEALKHYLQTDSILTANNLIDIRLGNIKNNIGLIYLKLKNIDKAEDYFRNAEKVFSDLEYKPGLMSCKSKLAQVAIERKNYLLAINNLLETKQYYKNIKNSFREAEENYNLGLAYFGAKKITEAFRVLKEALQQKSALNDTLGIIEVRAITAELRLKNNQPKQSYEEGIIALQLSQKIGDLRLQKDILYNLSEVEYQLGNYKEAHNHLKTYTIIADSLQKNENEQVFQKLETEYQTKEKEQEVQLLTSQNKLIEEQKTNQRNLFLVAIISISIAGFFLFFLYKNHKKASLKIKSLLDTKSRFFANISHEFRTPLTLISGPIQHKLKNEKLSAQEQADFKLIERNTNRLLSLINQLLDLSKIESGALKLSVSQQPLLPFVATLADSFTFITKSQNITYTILITPYQDKTWYDKDVLEKIILNLISNAVKYTNQNGTITINCNVKNEQFHFTIENTGRGLTKEEISKVFDRFYQSESQNQGMGIGLSLVKDLVKLHKGTIIVDSKPNIVTTFSVTLPISKNTYTPSELEISSDIAEKQIPFSLEQTKTKVKDIEFNDKNDQPILLIIDDNEDVLAYIVSLFKNSYSIITANNGEEGEKLAIAYIPDIIISDVMMPLKTGIQLCESLKTNVLTSHIPIILLTAKADEVYEIESLKIGADSYITKPFNQELLKLKVENFIENRRQLQSKYSQELILKPKNVVINKTDVLFLDKIQVILDENLNESSFSIDEFCKLTGMSRMQLHRKLKSLTGLSTSEFIRSQRLKLAAELLKQSDINISQVGYSVGFNNHAYFSKCFKQQYNCSPTEYVKKK